MVPYQVAYPPGNYVVATPVTVDRPAVVLPYTTYYVGSGMVGQTKVDVAGQPVRNVFRFITP